MGEGGARGRDAGSPGGSRGVVDRRRGLPGGCGEGARCDGSRPARRNRVARAGAGAEGAGGRVAARCAARAGARQVLPRGPGGARGGERAGRAAGRGGADVFERRARRDRSERRAHAADTVGRRGGEGGGSAREADPRGLGSGLVIRFDVVTLFPEMFGAVAGSGITGRALEAGLWSLTTWNPRDFATDSYRTVDERPYGGGPGMVMLAEPLDRALDAVSKSGGSGKTIYLSPQGKKLDHPRVMELVQEHAVTLLCGRYEGVDERLLRRRVDEEISIGDFVLSGGELAAMALMDAVVRQLPGAVGEPASVIEESFADGLLDCPQYTRPETYRGEKVPDVLLSGHHENIRRWRLKQALGRTWLRRPDLLAVRRLNDEESRLLEEFRQESGAKS